MNEYDEIRARCEAALKACDDPEVGVYSQFFCLKESIRDVPGLLAEVERLECSLKKMQGIASQNEESAKACNREGYKHLRRSKELEAENEALLRDLKGQVWGGDPCEWRMDKLTDWDFEGDFCRECPFRGESAGCNRSDGECDMYHICMQEHEKLTDYERTDLTPEEVAELARAKAEGRLVVLPCKIGATVYRARSIFGSTAIREEKFDLSHYYLEQRRLYEGIYLTREAAEAALANREQMEVEKGERAVVAQGETDE